MPALSTVDMQVGYAVVPVAASNNACCSANIRYWHPEKPPLSLWVRACKLSEVHPWWCWSQMFNVSPSIGAVYKSIHLYFSKTDAPSVLIVVAHNKICPSVNPFCLSSAPNAGRCSKLTF